MRGKIWGDRFMDKVRLLIGASALILGVSVQTMIPVGAFAKTNELKTNIYVNNQLVASPEHIVSVISSSQTSFIPLTYVQQVLQKLGIQNSWDGFTRTLNLVNSQIQSMNLSNAPLPKTITSTEMRFDTSGTTIGYGSCIVEIDPISGLSTTYVSVYDIELILHRFGFKSTWNGSSWLITGSILTNPSTAVLTLQVDKSIEAMLPSLSVPDPAPVSITLPLYPGSIVTNQTMTPSSNVPMESYVQYGGAKYNVPASLNTVEIWYKQAFENAGYVASGNENTLFFFPQKQPNRQKIDVELTFNSESNDQTGLTYWVLDVVLPKRPSNSLIPTGVGSVNISMGLSNNTNVEPQPNTVDVTNPTIIQNLIKAINSLTLIKPYGIIAGPEISSSETPQTAILTFHETDGNSMTVHDTYYNDESVVTVSNIPLQDPNENVWNVILSAIATGNSNS